MTTSIGCRCRGGNVRSRAVLIARRLIVRIFFKGASGFLRVCFFSGMLRYWPPGLSRGKGLRWPLRRGSPLPIPNREVKPVSADGTASWESRSPPCLESPSQKVKGIFFVRFEYFLD